MKDYYTILRVRRFAGIPEIKRSYRTLVQKYHPDINPDPTATELIKEINEAYDVLSDSVKKSDYDYRLTTPYQHQESQPPQPAHRDPYYKKRRVYRPVNRGPSQYDLIVQYFHYVKKVSVTGLAICFILFVDYSLPNHVIREHAEVRINYRNGQDYLVTSSGRAYKAMWDELIEFKNVPEVDIIESAILRKVIEIRRVQTNSRITKFASVYGSFMFVPVVLFISAMLCLFIPNNLDFRFGLCVLTSFALFFTIILMFV